MENPCPKKRIVNSVSKGILASQRGIVLPPNEQALFVCKDLSYSIGKKKILKQVSFSIFRGEISLLRGDNGAGKTTLLRAILNHDRHKNCFTFQNRLSAVKISYLGHELGLYTSLSLEENLRYFLPIAKIQYSKEKVETLLRAFQLWTRRLDPIFTFSRGMKQKAALVRTLLTGGDLILLDEPFTALDRSGLETAIRLLNEYSQNSAVLMVTHDPGISFGRRTVSLTLKEGNLETSILSSP
ncbi:ABC transporter ATP-binding protein [Leptospira interrogans]|uniref:ABC transporter ATP-binding protein n=1 Tax=Leptospira interrogans TaxID=173 RepID=UPI0002BBE8D2|nr:ATP-binding cassette domain-containing protein [Leptospira interrogans]KWV23351.1 ABC transporter ATP-binding protein [Leptospira interrogans]KWV24079.1 ABC transporter ATP-binding protein [Leptospira interrogans]